MFMSSFGGIGLWITNGVGGGLNSMSAFYFLVIVIVLLLLLLLYVILYVSV